MLSDASAVCTDCIIAIINALAGPMRCRQPLGKTAAAKKYVRVIRNLCRGSLNDTKEAVR